MLLPNLATPSIFSSRSFLRGRPPFLAEPSFPLVKNWGCSIRNSSASGSSPASALSSPSLSLSPTFFPFSVTFSPFSPKIKLTQSSSLSPSFLGPFLGPFLGLLTPAFFFWVTFLQFSSNCIHRLFFILHWLHLFLLLSLQKLLG